MKFAALLSVACASVLFVSNAAAQAKIPVLIVSGANNHDWQWTSPSLERMLEKSGRFEADITYEPAKALADAALLARYKAVVLDYNGPRWGEAAEKNFLEAVRGGVGVAVIHAANNAFAGWSEYELLVGACWRDGTGHGAFHEFDLKVVDGAHPITRGLGAVVAHPDELYHKLVRTPGATHQTLATAFSSQESGGTGRDEPMILVASYGQGRVFHTPLGHVWPGVPESRASHEDPQFQRLVARGVEWAATGGVAEGRAAVAANFAGGEEWNVLFDGVSTAKWRGYNQKGFPEKGWGVVDGALVCTSGGGDLITTEQFDDFELEFEWRVTPKANSGVMYRVVESKEPTYVTGPEYQVLDNGYFDGKIDYRHSAGALYEVCPANERAGPRKVGEFNQARIVVQGFKVAHFLNGRLVAQCDFASPEGRAAVAATKFAQMPNFMKSPRGHIALQDHGNEVAFRNIRIRALEKPLALFNGKNLDGWTFHLNDGGDPAKTWSVDAEGVLVCTGKPAGYIRTKADYTNYVLEFDWRWNPEGEANRNSGVLLRMVGEDKVWPKSLEAQLQSGSAGDFWVIDEYPCVTDPKRTKGRNCKRVAEVEVEKPLGEWNHYRITVEHGNVALEINDQVVNAATEVLETPGKICLQSEGAEIHFRNITLRPLK
jgi:type 1 glutamine amidotransferase